MRYDISVDVGSTFTDAIIRGDTTAHHAKVETTPHDLTVCLLQAIEAANKFGLPLDDLLRQTEAVKFGSTVVTNAVILGRGPKLGMLVTRGVEQDEGLLANVERFAPRDLIVGVNEKVNEQGKVGKETSEEEVRSIVKDLAYKGMRGLVIAFSNSWANPVNEQRAKAAIAIDYPKHCLGAFRVFLSSDLCVRTDEIARIGATVLSAYVHREVARCLYKSEDELGRKGYLWQLMVLHCDQGMSRVAKSTALKTWGAGPAAGVEAARTYALAYGVEDVICIDCGGTSSDIALITKGSYGRTAAPVIEGIKAELRTVDLESVGIGGTSIVTVKSGKINVGPGSAGALPGPVCYDLGGAEATLCDACLVLGYFDPDYYFGGKRKLNRELATEAIRNDVADKLGVPLEQSAYSIYQQAAKTITKCIKERLTERGLRAGAFHVLSFGGSGGLVCCELADQLGIDNVIIPPFSSVFSALGGMCMDVAHSYEERKVLALQNGDGSYLRDYALFNGIVEELKTRGLDDMFIEGAPREQIVFDLELEMRDGKGSFSSTIEWPKLSVESEEEVKAICEAFVKQFTSSGRGTSPAGGIWAEVFRLRATWPVRRYEFAHYPFVGEDPAKALKGERTCFWGDGSVSTKIYERSLLEVGNAVSGPAIIESEDMNVVVPRGWRYTHDKFMGGTIEKIKAG